MKKLKHQKFKNTGLLFELLLRQVTSDTLNNTDSKALPLLKKYFSNTSDLSKELALYNTLVREVFDSREEALRLIEAVVSSRKSLNQSKLNNLKYNLIKEISTIYESTDFFKSKVRDYTTLASICNIFEYAISDNPADSVRNRTTIAEHITRSNPVIGVDADMNESLAEFVKQDEDIRLLSYKILVDKFNEKYSNLNEGQRNLLRQYINSVSDCTDLRDYIISEAKSLKNSITKLNASVDDDVVRIKLNEVANLLDSMTTIKATKDSHVVSLLGYYELVKELETVISTK